MSELASTIRPGLHLPMSWETYDSLDFDEALRGAEYMDGELVVPPGAPDWGHQDAILYLLGQLRPTLAEGEGVTTGVGWKPEGILEEYIPDVIVCEIPEDRRRFTGVPLLCVEVTSSNRANDLVKKRNAYAAAGLKDYWIVDRKERALRVHELRDGVLVETDVWQLPHLGGRTARNLRQHDSFTHTARYAGRQIRVDLLALFP